MKKLILASLAALTLVPSVAMAQPAAQSHRGGHDARDTRHNVRDTRQDRQRVIREYNRTNPWRAAPFRYTRFNVGARIQPSYYGSRYVVKDYQRFHWSRPGANQRWVRHYDDALLVNTRTGRVVKVIYNAFR
ncbi:MAG TPA: RcnB family protein [Sphingobium sp.]|nr:RcnB family protein [Sphingobium sp.]